MSVPGSLTLVHLYAEQLGLCQPVDSQGRPGWKHTGKAAAKLDRAKLFAARALAA
jgi:hypothetical protein